MAHTFLFADLVGFTALTDAEGDERAAEVALALIRLVRELAPDSDIKGLGDGVMVRCGDPAEAVRLALCIVAADGLPPVRVGVHTGTAVSRDGDWYGQGVNVAARLCSVAAGGEVIVSETARAGAGAAAREIEFGDRRLHWLRNVTKPIGAYAAVPRDQDRPCRARAARTRLAKRFGLRRPMPGIAT